MFTGPAIGTTSPSVHQSKEPQSLDESYIGIIVGALAALVIVLCLIVVIVIMGYRRRKHNNNRRTCMLKPMPVDGHVTINLNDLRANTNGKISNGNMYNSVALEELEMERELCTAAELKSDKGAYLDPSGTIQSRQLPDLPPTPDSSGTVPIKTTTMTNQ